MDAISLLKDDHRKVEKLFAQIKDEKDAADRERLFAEIKTELTVHTEIEPAIRSLGPHEVTVELHPEITETLKIVVASQ